MILTNGRGGRNGNRGRHSSKRSGAASRSSSGRGSCRAPDARRIPGSNISVATVAPRGRLITEMHALVLGQVALGGRPIRAYVASVWLFSGMSTHVRRECALVRSAIVADGAAVRTLSRVPSIVCREIRLLRGFISA